MEEIRCCRCNNLIDTDVDMFTNKDIDGLTKHDDDFVCANCVTNGEILQFGYDPK